jgi:mono/diheme cytochrome c family protein
MRVVRAVVFVAIVAFSSVLVASLTAQQTPEPAASDSRARGWEIPAGAAKEPNPIPASPETLEKGKKLFTKQCRRCHGESGKGDGPDAEPDDPPGNLTDPTRAARNPDGVMFYKIWNGRKSPKMPGAKTEGWTKDDVWAVVHYAKTLRQEGK